MIFKPPLLLALFLSREVFAYTRTSVWNVLDHGVLGDGLEDDTAALQGVLNVVPPGSVVVVPAGRVVVTGPLTVRQDGITLQIDGILQAWDVVAITLDEIWPRLPPLPTYGDSRDAGQLLQYQALIFVTNVTNLRITGCGKIDGRGQPWWDAIQFNRSLLRAGRPNLIQIVNSSGIEIDSVTLQDAAFWTLHPVLSQSIHIHHITIRAPLYAPNVDGIDPEYVPTVHVT